MQVSGSNHLVVSPDNVREIMAKSLRMVDVTIPPISLFIGHDYLHIAGAE